MTPKMVKTKYNKRIVAVLEKLRTAIATSGHYASEIWDDDCDEYLWVTTAAPKFMYPPDYRFGDEDKSVDITFKICESETYDGSKGGVNFAIDIVADGGEIVGGFCPMNYTQHVWVSRKDKEAVETRFRMMERPDAEAVVELLENYWKRKEKK